MIDELDIGQDDQVETFSGHTGPSFWFLSPRQKTCRRGTPILWTCQKKGVGVGRSLSVNVGEKEGTSFTTLTTF